MRAMILAAGFGTRLRPLTEQLPKPMVPVLGRPLIEHTIGWLRRWDVREVVINLHHLPQAIPEALGDGARLGVAIEYLREEGEIRGTGGGILGARSLLDNGETFLVLNGDVLMAPDLDGALALHRRLDAVATLVLRRDDRAERFGALGVDESGQVRTLLGRPEPAPGQRLEQTMFTGVHLLEPEVFDRLPETGCIVRQTYRPLLDEGAVIGGWIDGGPWVELGTVADYLRVNLALASGELRLDHLPSPPASGVVRLEGVEVADESLLEAPLVIGDGAAVRARASRSVIWSGAEVREPVDGAVVTSTEVVTPSSR